MSARRPAGHPVAIAESVICAVIRWVALLTLGCLLASVVQAAPWMGRVVAVHDGDTVTVLRNRKPVRIRLHSIDAPELDQAYGQQSRRALSNLCYDRYARVYAMGTDKYDRTLALLECGGREVNAEQLRRGWAWFYTDYSDDADLKALEAGARAARLGLWADPDPVPPWAFRHHEADSRRSPSSSSPPQGRWGLCGDKRYCSQMSSCVEAFFFQRICGVTSLDGNHDGVPCESLCKPGAPHR